MHWIIQNNMHNEDGHEELLRTLIRLNIPHSLHRVIPFVGKLDPDIDVEGPVICIGTYSMWRAAHAKSWVPGVFKLSVDMDWCNFAWGDNMLNYKMVTGAFGEIQTDLDEFFTRPLEDSKCYAGQVITKAHFKTWQDNINKLGENNTDGTGLSPETKVLIAEPVNIVEEVRHWVVDAKIVTSSYYRRGGRLYMEEAKLYDDHVLFACDMIRRVQPKRAFVLDTARTSDDKIKIIEINTPNCSGFYKANIGKLVEAIESMDGYSTAPYMNPRETRV